MKLLLISTTPIIKQIFNLVTSKLNIELTILDVNIVSSHFDIIVIEDTLFDDKFPTNDFTNKLGIVTKDKLSYQDDSDFILPKPFLPSLLLDTIKEQIHNITIPSKRSKTEEIVSIDEAEASNAFLETLVEDISDEIIEESDESVVSSAFIDDGGILDTSELSKIQDILSDDTDDTNNSNIDEVDDWVDLADIIDKAIDEVREYQFNVKEPIKLVLNDYSINEVSDLLNKLDQNIVDALVAGEEITLKMRVKE